jgi:murein DD-endopeptidase MepM/ murein hydrolase activator NlpD
MTDPSIRLSVEYPLTRPTITQLFGANPGNYTRFGYPAHNGLDLWTAESPPLVMAIAAGIVEKVGFEDGGYGKYVVIKHPRGEAVVCRSTYAHLASVHVRPAQSVDAGQPIAIMGATGNVTGPHLHLGIRCSNDANPAYKGYIDPLPVLRSGSPPQPSDDGRSSSLQTPLPSAATQGEGQGDAARVYDLPGSILVKQGKKKSMYRMRRFF